MAENRESGHGDNSAKRGEYGSDRANGTEIIGTIRCSGANRFRPSLAFGPNGSEIIGLFVTLMDDRCSKLPTRVM